MSKPDSSVYSSKVSTPPSPHNSQQRRCSFVVTGFGPFNGVPNNPTQTLIRRLQSNESRRNLNIVETRILETSAIAAWREIDDIYDRVVYSGAGSTEGQTVVVLHLGVNYAGTCFQLEQCAYNDATFRVPDEQGYMPHGVCILGNVMGHGMTRNGATIIPDDDASSIGGADENRSFPEFGKCLNTTLDLSQICDKLQDTKTASVLVSHDPGRFVCNYTYCLSLDRCLSSLGQNTQVTNIDCSSNENAGVSSADMHSYTCHALFVHVPPFGVVPEDKQLEFILDIMEAIEQQLIVPET